MKISWKFNKEKVDLSSTPQDLKYMRQIDEAVSSFLNENNSCNPCRVYNFNSEKLNVKIFKITL